MHSIRSSVALQLPWRSRPWFLVGTVVVCLLADAFAYGMTLPVLPSLLRRLGVAEGEFQVLSSTIVSIHAGSSMIFFPAAGMIVYRAKTRKIPMMAGLVIFSAGTVLFFQAKSTTTLLVAKALQGGSSAILWTAGFALCYDAVESTKIGTTLGTVLSANDVGSLISPPLGGVVYRQMGRLGLMLISILFLGVSLVMTLMMDEKRVLTRLALVQKRRCRSERQNFSHSITSSDSDEDLPMVTAEETMDKSSEKFHPQEENNRQPYVSTLARNWLLRTVPILPCLRHPALIVAVGVCAVQAALLGAFDATIPLEAKSLFEFGTTMAGLLFIPIGCARLAAGPLGGWAVDRYGPKQVAVVCYSALVPVLLLFDLLNPQPRSAEIALYCVLLTLCGIGMGGVATAGFVEAGNIVEQYHESNPKHFGADGPFALLYGLNLMVFSLGMTLGSLMAGDFRQWAGYGNMMAVLAGLSCLAAFAAHVWMAEKSSM